MSAPPATSPFLGSGAQKGGVILKVDDVHQALGGHVILEGVSFDVHDRFRPGHVTGQVVALLGPSGVGKTRLIRLIAGLDVPDKGRITDGAGQPLDESKVGVVFQNYPLLRHRTVLSNLVMAGRAAGLTAKEATDKATVLLNRFGIGNRLHHYPTQISGGQRQRAAIAQQLMTRKALVLMDEPFSGLDPAALDEVIKLLLEVAHMDELNTVVVVTHDIRAALVVADTILMLGRPRDAEGNVKGGARIQHAVDLVEEGLAYRPDLEGDPRFGTVERDLKSRFKFL